MSKAERTRDRIIKAAAEAVRARGPSRVSVAEIMKRLNLTHGGFYAHFASKDVLVAAAIDEAFREMEVRRQGLVDGRAPEEALAACIEWYVSSEMRDFPERACPLTTLSGELDRMPVEAASRMGQEAFRLASCLEHLLQHADLPDPAALALSVAAEMVGAVILARMVGDRTDSDRLLSTIRASLRQRLRLTAVSA